MMEVQTERGCPNAEWCIHVPHHSALTPPCPIQYDIHNTQWLPRLRGKIANYWWQRWSSLFPIPFLSFSPSSALPVNFVTSFLSFSFSPPCHPSPAWTWQAGAINLFLGTSAYSHQQSAWRGLVICLLGALHSFSCVWCDKASLGLFLLRLRLLEQSLGTMSLLRCLLDWKFILQRVHSTLWHSTLETWCFMGLKQIF